MIIILYSRPDGGVSCEHPAYLDRTRPSDDTDEALRDRCRAKTMPRLVSRYGNPIVAYEIDRAHLPESDDNQPFFNAWEWVDNACKVNMVKARDIHMDRIRIARNKKLLDLDIPFIRALEVGDIPEQMRLAQDKQTLRDIPQNFDLSTFATPKQLSTAYPIWPSGT